MTSNLTAAAHQWAFRPIDQRFWTPEDALAASIKFRDRCRSGSASWNKIRVKAHESSVVLDAGNVETSLTHHSFGQICQIIGAPASYLRSLPASIAAENVNFGLVQKSATLGVQANGGPDPSANILVHYDDTAEGPAWSLRAITTDTYTRLWNAEILERLVTLKQMHGWRVPPGRPVSDDPRLPTRAATEEDVLKLAHTSLGVKVGDKIAPSGIYVSDHDMFVFMVNEDCLIEDGLGGYLARGFFVSNSEVGVGPQTMGSAALRFTFFWYKSVCGNHIVWDAQNVHDVRLKHVGRIGDRLEKFAGEIKQYMDTGAKATSAKIQVARKLEIAGTKEEVLDKVFGLAQKKKLPTLTKGVIKAAYEKAETKVDQYGPPTTAWGLYNGLTDVSQRSGFADVRSRIDTAAGKLFAALVG